MPYTHTYDHPAEETVMVTGTYGTFCAGCYDAATDEDDTASITVTTPHYW